jgi:sugar-phosphatase
VPNIAQRAHGRRSVDTVREIAPHLDPEAEVQWLADAELNDFEGLVVLPGAATVLASLPENRRAVVTSAGRELARRRLEHAKLRVPRVLVAAEDVRQGKPSPDGYLAAARQLGVQPSRCIVVEDTPAGVASGRTAGATVIALATTFPRKSLQAATYVVDSLDEILIAKSGDSLLIQINSYDSSFQS